MYHQVWEKQLERYYNFLIPDYIQPAPGHTLAVNDDGLLTAVGVSLPLVVDTNEPGTYIVGGTPEGTHAGGCVLLSIDF